MGDLYRLNRGRLALTGALALALSLALPPRAAAELTTEPTAKTDSAAEPTPAAPTGPTERAAANAPSSADQGSAGGASDGYIDHNALPPTTLPPTQSLRAPEPGSEAILIAQPPTEAAASAPNWLYIIGGALVFLGVLWILRGAPASQPQEPLPDTDKEPT
ncbi:MAG: hypothetical protein Tsb0020_51840 [Haliangiales bacterium]